MKAGLLSVMAAMFFLASCQKEMSYETGTGSGTGTGGSPSNIDCKNCIYVPMCDGAWYSYNDTISGTAQIVSDTLLYVKDTSIDSKTFKVFFSKTQFNNTYTNCTNGESRVISYNNIGVGGSSVSKIDLILLKANLAVNGTWTDSIKNGASQTVLYIDSIKEKGVTRTINGQAFNDVIRVHIEIGIVFPPLGFVVTNTGDYYYAKGVGLVEVLVLDATSGMVVEHRTIKNYFIP